MVPRQTGAAGSKRAADELRTLSTMIELLLERGVEKKDWLLPMCFPLAISGKQSLQKLSLSY